MSQSIERQMADILNEYWHLSADVVEKASRKAARNSVNRLKAVSPKRTGEYASGWSAKKQDHGYVVYNKKAPGLTHLLEYGHVVINAKGRVGRAPGYSHIASVEQQGIREYEETLRKELSK